MRAWLVTRFCEPHEMELASLPARDPGPGEVRIAVHAAALNFFDILQIQGKYQVRPPFPFTPGAEVGGIVEAVGEGVTRVKPGDRVQAMLPIGGMAEKVTGPADFVYEIPAEMGFDVAAAMPIVYQTSYFALRHRALLRAGETLLVHAAAGGVGLAALQIGKTMAARVIATAGSPEKLAFCKEHGADETLDYGDPSWPDKVKELTRGRGADVVYDPVGGEVFDKSMKCLAWEGRLLVVGFAGGKIPTVEANRVLLKNVSIVGVHWGEYRKHDPGLVHEAQLQLQRMWEREQIRPIVSKRYKLEEAPQALADLGARRTHGKIVLQP
jgi:NADPH2:quinone reductase